MKKYNIHANPMEGDAQDQEKQRKPWSRPSIKTIIAVKQTKTGILDSNVEVTGTYTQTS